MPIKQTHSDLNSAPQKLSKIETLRLAKNYILAMSQTLQEGRPMEMGRFVKVLSRDLSQTTGNLLAGTLMGMGTDSINNYRRYCIMGENDNSCAYNNGGNYNRAENYFNFNHQQAIFGSNYCNPYWSSYKHECDPNNGGKDMHNFRYWENNYAFSENCLYNIY